MTTGDIPENADAALATLRYAAFISYSHADEAAAKRLHRRLETYRLPPQVRDARDRTRIGSIFRDRADLAAATSLTDAIKDALAGSGALIVLCSPEAKQSQWVDAEIRLFRDLHPAAPVLAVILRGEPADGMPAALIEDGREPLAADFRKQGDGDKLGFLKVVAALKAVPLDSLIQRDAQRNLRRVTTITVLVGVALIAMATMTAFAINARNEAQRQRAEAEGLIEYMLTDLREGLRGVGRLDVMSAVNDRAMDYYRSQGDLSRLPADSLSRRATVLHAMGEDDLARGENVEAMQRFVEAHRTTAALLAPSPGDPDRLFAHAQSEYWVGYAHLSRSDFSHARQRFQAYRELAQRLKDVDPDQDRADREVGYAEGNLCGLEISDTANSQPGGVHCRRALEAMQRVASRRPSDAEAQLALANRHAWLATALDEEGDASGAISELNRANAILGDVLSRDQGNADYLDMLAGNFVVLAERQIEAGERSAARATLERAESILVLLVRRDPERQRWQGLLSQVRNLRQGRQPNRSTTNVKQGG